MIKTMEMCEKDAAMKVADLMVSAAVSAPKGSGRDTVVAMVVSGEEKDTLRDTMLDMGKEFNEDFIIRDAGNVDRSICVVIIGCTDTPFRPPDPCSTGHRCSPYPGWPGWDPQLSRRGSHQSPPRAPVWHPAASRSA